MPTVRKRQHPLNDRSEFDHSDSFPDRSSGVIRELNVILGRRLRPMGCEDSIGGG
jgi:hypothetical protein